MSGFFNLKSLIKNKMKPLYYVIIAIVVIVIIALIIKNNNNKKIADANVAATQNQIINPDSSQVASIISSIFPYFQTGINAITKPKPTSTQP